MEKEQDHIIGLPEQNLCLTATELRAMADAVESLEPVSKGDQTIILDVDGMSFKVTFGWDDTGNFGVLSAWTMNDETL